MEIYSLTSVLIVITFATGIQPNIRKQKLQKAGICAWKFERKIINFAISFHDHNNQKNVWTWKLVLILLWYFYRLYYKNLLLALDFELNIQVHQVCTNILSSDGLWSKLAWAWFLVSPFASIVNSVNNNFLYLFDFEWKK